MSDVNQEAAVYQVPLGTQVTNYVLCIDLSLCFFFREIPVKIFILFELIYFRRHPAG